MKALSRTVAITLAVCISGCSGGPPPGVSPERREAEEGARRAVAQERSLTTDALQPQSLGIPPFGVNAPDTILAALGYGLADLLTTDLARSSRLQIVERLRLDAVLREIGLVESGRVDRESAPRVGKLVQARRLVLGGLSETPAGNIDIDARIADVATGEVRSAVTAGAPLADILRAEKELAFRLFDQLGVTLSPAERSAVEQLPTKNVSALLAYSRGVKFEAEGRYGDAATAYRQAVQLDPGFQGSAEHLQSVEQAAPPLLPATQQANAGPDRARDVVADRISDLPMSPIGGQLIASPAEGGADIALPTTVIITVTVPE